MTRRCPNCNKKLYWNYDKKRWDCPKIKGGCGYKLILKRQQKLIQEGIL